MTDEPPEPGPQPPEGGAPAPGEPEDRDRLRARAAFLAHMRHELRTPVNAIIGYSEMLLEGREAFPPGLAADLARIQAAGQTLLALINQILSPSRLESGAIDIDAFGAEMRHHLRTPVNAVIGYCEMILEETETLPAEAASDVRRIREAGVKLLALIEDILELSRVESGEKEVRPDESVSSLIRGVVATIRPLSSEAERAGETPGGRLLVVDDNEVNRDMLSRRLTREGYAAEAAADGRTALRMLAEEPFDLVLLDVMMPGMNGYQVLEFLKADRTLRHVPVIMISALDEIDSVVRCIEMGAEDYLPKPFNPILLRARIGASLEKKRLRDREVLHLRRIEEEKRRVDDLLHVILPDEIVEELKRTNRVRPRRHEDVAVLFCDIVGFTPYCSTRQPEEILANLQQLFELYEDLAARHQMYKIKTIGDCFMSTAGLIVPLANPVENAVRCGLEMVAGSRSLPAAWEVRVGIHVGPVMAGVVGRRQYLYDLWGDTVNTASRVESHGLKGAVCLSQEAWRRVDGLFRASSRGAIPVKGKGDMEIYRIEEAARS
jgi:adenylate cyclase